MSRFIILITFDNLVLIFVFILKSAHTHITQMICFYQIFIDIKLRVRAIAHNKIAYLIR